MADVNWYNNTVIAGTDGDDSITNAGNYVTVTAGAGNDSVFNQGVGSMIYGGEGNDTIYNNTRASLAAIDGGAGNDSITNWAAYVTINAGAGNDTIRNYYDASLSAINVGSGNDYVYNYGPNASVFAEGGRTTISNSGDNLIVIGSSSNDFISVGGGSNDYTVATGGGNDTIISNYTAAEVIQFDGGSLLLENYNYDDVIELSHGSVASYNSDGGDLILNISDGSVITLKSMNNRAVTIKDAGGNTSTQVYSNGYSPLAVIQNYVQSVYRSVLNSRNNMMDEAIRACSGFNSMQEVIDKMVSDCSIAGSAEAFLKDYCGIILDNDDTGAITGWDAGGLTAKTADNIMPETLPAETLSSLTHATYVRDNLTIYYPQTQSKLSDDEQRILQYAYSWWVGESLRLIKESYGISFRDTDVVSLSAVTSGNVGWWGLTSGSAYSNAVSINSYYTTFDDDDDLDANNVDRCLAHELTHVVQNLFLMSFPQFLEEGMAELTGGIDDQRMWRIQNVAGNAENLKTYLNLNNYSTGDSNYYAAGYMFWRYLAKQASDAYDSLKTYAWTENATLEGTSDADLLTASGEDLTVFGGGGDDTISGYGDNEYLIGGDGDDSIYIGSLAGGVTVNGGAGDDYIRSYGTERGYHIYEFDSNGGNDYVVGYQSNDTIVITDGADYSTLRSGSDVIVNVGDAAMTLQSAFGKTLNILKNENGGGDSTINNTVDNRILVGTENDDLILNNGGNRVTIDGVGGDDKLYNQGGSYVSINGGDGDDVVYNSFVAATDDFGNATNVGGDHITIVAGAGNDYVYNTGAHVTISGGAGNDTLWSYGDESKHNSLSGGAGNDSLIAGRYSTDVTLNGGEGDDTLVIIGSGTVIEYGAGDGNDLIVGYNGDDTIAIADNSTYSTSVVGEDVIVSIGGGKVTLKSAANYSINVAGGAPPYNVINNAKNKVKVTGTSDADYIVNTGEKVTIQAKSGNDTIVGSDYGETYLFAYGSGNNLITNFGTNDTIKLTAGTISAIKTVGDDAVVTIKSGSKKSTVTLQGAGAYNFVKTNTVLTVKNVNYIANDADNVTVLGTSDADSIVNYGEKVTIRPLGGNDTIVGSDNGEVFAFAYGSGNNLIKNFGTNDTIKATAGTISAIKIFGDDAVVTIAKGSSKSTITLGGAGDYDFVKTSTLLTVKTVNYITNDKDKVKVVGTSDADYIVNTGEKVTIQAKSGNDTIVGSDYGETYLFAYGSGNNVITNFGKNDTIKLTAGTISTIQTVGDDAVVTIASGSKKSTVTLGSAGDYHFTNSGTVLTVANSIDNTKNKVKVTGTSKADYITNYGRNVTISSGKGNDTIVGSDYGETYLFASSTGNNVITNFGTNDTLKCTAGSITSYAADGDDYVITMRGTKYTGSVRLIDAVTIGTLDVDGNILRLIEPETNAQLPSDDYWIDTTNLADISDISYVENNALGDVTTPLESVNRLTFDSEINYNQTIISDNRLKNRSVK